MLRRLTFDSVDLLSLHERSVKELDWWCSIC